MVRVYFYARAFDRADAFFIVNGLDYSSCGCPCEAKKEDPLSWLDTLSDEITSIEYRYRGFSASGAPKYQDMAGSIQDALLGF